MDRRAPGVWCVLALLVVSAAVSRAVNQITLVSMTWSTDPALGLTVCAENELSFVTSFLTVRFFNGSETGYGGLPEETDPNCTVFTDIADLPLPEVDATTYELTTYIGNDSVDEGKVTFAFPLSQGVKIDCGSSQFTRFSVVDGGDSALSGTGCISNSDSSACYFTGDSDPVCVPGLDQSLDEPDSFEVCVPNGDDPITATEGLITAVSLSYDEDRIGGIFTISSGVDMGTNALELLSVIHDSRSDPSVTTCDGNACTFASGVPSTDLYDLCSVYVDDDSSSVTSVGTYSFQDLQLTVDVVGDTTVDFRFANLNSEGDCIYDVYGSDTDQNPIDTFTLDCSHIDSTSFCNGFFDNEDSSLAYIGVSFSGENDTVIAPTTTPPTTTTTTTSTTSAPTVPPKVEENAMDLTDQKTEGIVPSSA